MQLRNLFDDDDAVSPVIGVILMVAITVILAAVIATFVLGLGEQVSDTAPQASFTFDFNEGADPDTADLDDSTSGNGDGVLTITHAGGATIQADQLGVAGSSVFSQKKWSASDQYGQSSEIEAGDDITAAVKYGDTIQVTWTNKQGTSSATLRKYTVPTEN